ncbi:YbaB/EbfC family nucleoid-associated protein [Patescibacteria group bacterium]|nr:YbaB/EbfC family nucleoid-associated protein [Patescibacteria group bacterium]
MFDKIKQFKELKNQLDEVSIEVEKDGIKLIMSGNQSIESIQIDQNLTAPEIERIIPDLFDQALKKVQKVMVEKFQTGNLNLPNV